MGAWTTQALYVSPETNQWMFSGQWDATGAETDAFVYSANIAEIVNRGAYLIVDGMTIGAVIAAGANVYAGIVHDGSPHVSVGSFTAAAATPGAIAITGMSLPITAKGEFVHVATTLAAADAVMVAMWGRWRVPKSADPQKVTVEGVKLWPTKPNTGEV